MIRNTKLQITTAACLLAILCYGLPFNDNALGGFVKPTSIIMAKSQKGGGQPPKKQSGGKVTNPKPPAATSDSTAYFSRASKSFLNMANSESQAGNQGTASKMIKLAKKADLDAKRQALKGKPGYDANGYPIKKKK